jgi:hypothetical protein
MKAITRFMSEWNIIAGDAPTRSNTLFLFSFFNLIPLFFFFSFLIHGGSNSSRLRFFLCLGSGDR